MKPETRISETNATEHFGTSGYHIANEHDELLPEDENVLVSEVIEPFATERLCQENESSVDVYLEKVKERFYKQPKVRMTEHCIIKKPNSL